MPQTYLQDSFTGVNGTNLTVHTMDVGPGWNTLTGTWTIQSNSASPPANTTDANINSDSGKSDGTLTLDCAVPNATDYSLGAVVRQSNASTGYIVAVERDGGATPYIGIFQSGTDAQLAVANCTGATNSTVTLTAKLIGSTITLSANTGESCTKTGATTNQTVTKHGLYCFTSFGYTAGTLDNFLFVGVPASSPTYIPQIDGVQFRSDSVRGL